MSVKLLLSGHDYQHFESLSVQRSLAQACGQMTLSYSGQTAIIPNAPFVLTLDGHTALTGYIDSLEADLSATGLSFSATGRDKAADLVDCSCETTGQLNGLNLVGLTSLLAGQYGVQVKSQAGLNVPAPFNSLSIEPGESVWSVIEKACRIRAVLAMSDGEGGLLLSRAGASVHPLALVEGQNVLSARVRADHSQRYHHYQCLAQQGDSQAVQWSATGTVDAQDQAAAQATATDAQARKPRRLSVVADQSAGSGALAERAAWECAVRKGKSTTVELEVIGFSGKGVLFAPNQLIDISLPSLGLADRLLIESLTHTLDGQGERTRLSLVNPNAYRLIPLPEPKDKSQTLEQWSAMPKASPEPTGITP